MKLVVPLLLLLLKAAAAANDLLQSSAVRKLAADNNPGVLNVHVVPHTHDDVGWLKTVEQYYHGWNNTIQYASVHSILTTVIQALLENPSRVFTYVEVKFFSMWWAEQTDATKDSVRWLIANHQFGFANGGWCMHDEASTHYMGMIDQTTLGHEFLKRELGVIPKVGWQLDPFGHSATQASLLTARTGFDALYFGRIDYQDMNLRKMTRNCEGLWKSTTASNNSTVFFGLTGSYESGYGPPSWMYCFDVRCDANNRLTATNASFVKDRVDTFLQLLRVQSDRTRGNHIMLTMGSDFQYSEAHISFAQMDYLIGYIMSGQEWGTLDSTIASVFGPQYHRINLFYSTPEYYTQQKYQETVRARDSKNGERASDSDVNWQTKTDDDFFPYSDLAHNFWTGYFTSRTGLKRYERVASSFLLTARQIEAQSGASARKELYELDDALGVVQHHDGVSGTAKQHVANDYSQRLASGMNHAGVYVAGLLKDKLGGLVDDNLTHCPALNETKCSAAEQAESEFDVVVVNPLAQEQSTVVRLPVATNGTYTVERLDGKKETVVVNTLQVDVSNLMEKPCGGEGVVVGSCPCGCKHVVAFDTGPLPPVGGAIFRVSPSSNATTAAATSPVATKRALRSTTRTDDDDVFTFDNGKGLTVAFDKATGMLQHVTRGNPDGRSSDKVNVTQTWGYYTSFDNKLHHSDLDDGSAKQNSGAYIFRPSTPHQHPTPLRPGTTAKFVTTSVGLEVHTQMSGSWVSQVTRITNGQPYIDVDYTIGPIPIDDGLGKEVVTRYSAPKIHSQATWYTDSNGREFLQRKRNYRPSWDLITYEPVAGNFYPVNAAMYLEDDKTASMAVLVDRSQGGVSLQDGTLEFMVQRRTLVDDSRGVGEPLNETTGGNIDAYPPFGNATRIGAGAVFKGTHRLLIGPPRRGAALARSHMDAMFGQPVVFVSSSTSGNVTNKPSWSALSQPLPANVMLITLAKIHENDAEGKDRSSFLVRLGHQYATGEDDTLSQPVQVDLQWLFPSTTIASVTEKTLTANQDWTDYLQRRFQWEDNEETAVPAVAENASPTVVTLNPMEIKTFVVVLGRN